MAEEAIKDEREARREAEEERKRTIERKRGDGKSLRTKNFRHARNRNKQGEKERENGERKR